MVGQDLDPQMDWKTSSNYLLQSKQIHDPLQVNKLQLIFQHHVGLKRLGFSEMFILYMIMYL